ncbi:MAG: surface-adhesin E family protein [Crinalium sp.]
MRGFLGLTLALTTALFPITEFSLNSSAIAAKPKWVRVSTNENNDVFYVDKSSIKRNGEFRYFWGKVVFAKPYKLVTNNKLAYSHISYKSIDCLTQVYRIRSVTALDRKGKVIGRQIDGEQGDINIALSDTSFSKVADFVCDK